MPIINFSRHLTNLRRMANPADGSRFWIGQIMVILSTVLGVYLAANAGFERAIEFDAMVNKRSAYRLLGSLEAELKDNITIVNKLTENLQLVNKDRTYMLRRHQTGKFIWQAMLESDHTFQVPAEVLTGVRRYYKNLEILRYELENSKIPSSYFITRIKEEHSILEKTVLPKIDNEKQHLGEILSQLDISYDE